MKDDENQKKIIHIPEITRVEGHAAVDVTIVNGKVKDVKLDVFEGTRFFEQIVVGHKYDEIPHITSRVCAICSTGHVIAAAKAIEHIFGYTADPLTERFRELMHLGMVIESHATHIYALALPDFLGVTDLVQFATRHPDFFADWTHLRNLGSTIQTVVGGRPFHPVNLHVGGLSRYPIAEELRAFLPALATGKPYAERVCQFLLERRLLPGRSTKPAYMALVPPEDAYGFFGQTIRCSDGWDDDVQNYKRYLSEKTVPHTHAKQSTARGSILMVGAMARLHLFGNRLQGQSRAIWQSSPLYNGDTNTIWNNLAQAIEIVFALERVEDLVKELSSLLEHAAPKPMLASLTCRAGSAVGAVECPRGTLYHFYELNENGVISQADMITPSAQNTRGIEIDIREVVENLDVDSAAVQGQLETLVRAYDPCNTCATHMVSVKFASEKPPDAVRG